MLFVACWERYGAVTCLSDLFQDQGEVLLLKNIEPILKELELHQASYDDMFGFQSSLSHTRFVLQESILPQPRFSQLFPKSNSKFS